MWPGSAGATWPETEAEQGFLNVLRASHGLDYAGVPNPDYLLYLSAG